MATWRRRVERWVLMLVLLAGAASGAAAAAQPPCIPSTDYSGSIAPGDGSSWPLGFGVTVFGDVRGVPLVLSLGSTSNGTLSFHGDFSWPVGSYQFRGHAKPFPQGSPPYYEQVIGGAVCTVDAAGCGHCTGGFHFSMFSIKGNVVGKVERPADAPDASVGVIACLERAGCNASVGVGADASDFYTFRPADMPNNWGLLGVEDPGPGGGGGSAVYLLKPLGAGYENAEFERVTVTSNGLATQDFTPEQPRCPANAGSNAPPGPSANVGHPVNVLTGNMWLDQTDISVPALGRPLTFTRSYNSINSNRRVAGVFGAGWTHSYERRLSVPRAGRAILREADGNTTSFHDPDGDGTYTAVRSVLDLSTLTRSGELYVRSFREGGSETYDGSGRLVALQDVVGHQTVLSYGAAGRLERVTDSGSGRFLEFGYEDGRIRTLSGPTGTIASYEYHPGGRLKQVAYDDASGYTFTYNNAGQLREVKDLEDVVLETHEYDTAGRAYTSERSGGIEKLTVSYEPGMSTVTDALGTLTRYEWKTVNGTRRVTRIVGGCPSCGGTAAGETSEWEYDEAGRIVAARDAEGNTTQYGYDPATGDLLWETDPLGKTTRYSYDERGRVLTVSRPDGGLTRYENGPAGPTKITEKIAATKDRVVDVTYLAGRPKTMTDPRGKVTTLVHDEVTGDLTSVTDPPHPVAGKPGPESHTTSFVHDPLGRRTQVTDAVGTTVTTYDGRSRGRVKRISYPPVGGAAPTHTDFTYDRGGRRTSVTDPNGNLTRYTYDAYGRLESVIDALGGVTRYGYDAMSNLTSLTDAEGRTTYFEYDRHYRVERTIYPGGAFEAFSYDPVGRLATKVDRKGVTTTYTYDLAGRLVRKEYSGGTPAVTDPPVTYGYDAVSRLISASNGTDTLTWKYDIAGQLVRETSDKNNSAVSYGYDLAGNRESMSLSARDVEPTEAFVTYKYDDASLLEKILRGDRAFSFTYDAVHRRRTMTYPNGVSTVYDYDDLNRLRTLAASKGSTPVTSFVYRYDNAGNRMSKTQLDYAEQYTYDALYRLTGAERTGAGANRWLWSYDRVGNRLSEQIGNAVTTSSYNEKNQLLGGSAGGPLRWRGTLSEAGNVTFTSALVNGKPARMLAGNTFEAMLDATPGTNTVTVRAQDVSGNVTTKQYRVNVSGTGATHTYDANGNLETKSDGTDMWRYVWNAESQLVRVEKNGAEVARYAYDPIGRRVERTEGSVTTTYAYAGEDILRESRSSGAVKYVHGPGIDEPLAWEDGAGALSFLQADGLGSVVATTSAAGAVVSTVRYDAWGRPEAGAPSFGFTGREWDGAARLWYYRARYYDPKAGRFISEDPIGFDGGINFYAYVSNNSVNRTDPLGLSSAIAWTFQIQHFLKHPPKPPLKCFLICIPSVYFDDLVALGAGAGASKLPWKVCKRMGGFVSKRIVPALGVLNLPSYVGCVLVCDRQQKQPCGGGEDECP